jgi:hypothetical protein
VASLAPETIDVILGGWGAPMRDYSGDPRSDAFEVFTLSDEDFGRLYRANRAALDRECFRRGLPERPWASRFVDMEEPRGDESPWNRTRKTDEE